jgi:hypothetical protein
MATASITTNAAERAVAAGLSNACFAYRSFLTAADEALRTEAGWTDGFLSLVERCAVQTVVELASCKEAIRQTGDGAFPAEVVRLVDRLYECWTQLAVVENECGFRYVRAKLLTSSQFEVALSDRVERCASEHGYSLRAN